MLSLREQAFKDAYISYSIMEALSTTSPEDREETIQSIQSELESTPFITIIRMAIDDRLIEDESDIYPV